MKHRLKLLVGSVLGLTLLGSGATAALVLTGNTAGAFEGVSSGNTVITNSPDGLTASYRTGVPVSGSFQSGILFTGQNFANVSDGDVFSLGMLTYYNGITKIGTSSANAMLDFMIHLDNPVVDTFLLTTITFGIDATVNSPGNLVPDQFTASFSQPDPILVDGTWVSFIIGDLPEFSLVGENLVVQLADVTVQFRSMSPVPEPSTYGLFGAVATLGLVGYRRYRAKRGNGDSFQPMVAA
jgi:hypothetical protein